MSTRENIRLIARAPLDAIFSSGEKIEGTSPVALSI